MENSHASQITEDFGIEPKRGIKGFFGALEKPSKKEFVPITAEGFRKRLLEFIVSTNQPFALVQQQSFIEFTKYCSMDNEKINLPASNTIKTWITEMYTSEKSKLRDRLFNNKGKISFVLDCWTSSNQWPFQGVIAAWIDEEWKLCHTVIDLTFLSGSHTGANIAEAFSKVLDEFDLWSKLHSVTTDNASNMDSMFKILDEKADMKMSDFNSSDFRVRCLAHILNLVCQAILKSVAHSTDEQIEDFDDSEDGSESELSETTSKQVRLYPL